MRTIVQHLPESDVILQNSLPKYPIIGFQIKVDSECIDKGWLQPLDYNYYNPVSKYRAFAVSNGVAQGNGWKDGTLAELLDWLNSGRLRGTAFLFQNEKELFAWLAE